MSFQFTHLLVPVDFTLNTGIAIQKALVLAEERSVIHLLHAPKTSSHFSFSSAHPRFDLSGHGDLRMAPVMSRMDQLKENIEEQRSDLRVVTHILGGNSVENTIIKMAGEINPNLILISKHSHHRWLPFLNTVVPSRVARKTKIPVLTVKPGSIDHDIKTVVVPIGQRFPQKKIEWINMLKKKKRMQVCLLSFKEDDGPNLVSGNLLHVYRLLRNESLNDIHYESISGKNRARAILDYCELVQADLLIVTPESETRLGWMNVHIPDAISPRSRTQVLAI